MRSAWEWRGFWKPARHVDLFDLADVVAARLGVAPPTEVMADDDAYLVIPGLRHNVKFRRGNLQIKVRVRSLADGFSLWEDKRVWRFPLDQQDARRLWRWLPYAGRAPRSGLHSPADFVSILQQLEPRLAIVPINKQRVRLKQAQSRLELASLELQNGVRLLSCCADGYQLDTVRELVHRSRLGATVRTLTYVELLNELDWWLAPPTEEARAA